MKLNHLINFKTSGTLLSASKFTISKILSCIPLNQDITILELGLGDGCISAKIIKSMSQNSKFIGVELNPQFYSELVKNINDDRVILINDSVLNLSKVLSKIKIKKIDVIVSTLPLSFFSKSEQLEIFKQISEHLKTDSIFIQAVHIPNILNLLKSYFQLIKVNLELRNLPPYFIIVCKKPF